MDENANRLSRKVIELFIIVVLTALLLNALYDVFHLFFGIFTFALIFSVSFATPYNRLCILFHHRRKLAALVYSIVLIALIAVPLTFLFSSLIHRVKGLVEWIGEVSKNGLPPLPGWISNLPFVGNDLHAFWTRIQADPKSVFVEHQGQIKLFLHQLVINGLGILGVSLQLVIGIIVSAILLYKGELAMKPIRTSLQHLIGKNAGTSLLETSGMAIRGVSIGVMGTAFIAAVFAWIGLTIGGIPIAMGLSAVIFFLVVIQVGPLLVWIPLIIYTISNGFTGLTVFFIIWGVALLIIDAVVKPILIGKSGGSIPFLALFIGVVGGVAAWGFTGMFKGAIIMALVYTIFVSWLKEKNQRSEQVLSS